MHACSTIKRFCLTIALLGIPQRLSWPVFPQRRLLCARCWRQVSAEEATKPRTDSPSPKQTPKHVLVKCPKPQNASCATCPRQVSAEGGEAHDNQILGTCGRSKTPKMVLVKRPKPQSAESRKMPPAHEGTRGRRRLLSSTGSARACSSNLQLSRF